MPDFANKEMAAWLEGAVKWMVQSEPVSIALAAKMPNGETMTAYYHADAERKAVLAHHIYSDVVMDVVTHNIGIIQNALDLYENGDDNDESENH